MSETFEVRSGEMPPGADYYVERKHHDITAPCQFVVWRRSLGKYSSCWSLSWKICVERCSVITYKTPLCIHSYTRMCAVLDFIDMMDAALSYSAFPDAERDSSNVASFDENGNMDDDSKGFQYIIWLEDDAVLHKVESTTCVSTSFLVHTDILAQQTEICVCHDESPKTTHAHSTPCIPTHAIPSWVDCGIHNTLCFCSTHNPHFLFSSSMARGFSIPRACTSGTADDGLALYFSLFHELDCGTCRGGQISSTNQICCVAA